MSNFGSFSYFQTSLSLGVEQGLQKLQKFDINDLRLLFHCNILIPRKCPRKTPFKAQCPPAPPPILFEKAHCKNSRVEIIQVCYIHICDAQLWIKTDLQQTYGIKVCRRYFKKSFVLAFGTRNWKMLIISHGICTLWLKNKQKVIILNLFRTKFATII